MLETAPASGKPFRMTIEWYRRTVKRVQQRLSERGVDGMILRDNGNVNWLIGFFLIQTERPTWLFLPVEGEPTMFGPGLDRDMYAEWWVKDYEWYFDFPHAGPFNQVVFDKGPMVDLTQWMLEGVAKRGLGEGRIGIEGELTPAEHRQWRSVLPKVEVVDTGDIPLQMRIRKTPEELALTQVAVDYHDKALQFARNYVIEKGPGVLDSQVRKATLEYLQDLVFSEFELTRRAHNGVGIVLGLGCCTGLGTAYPHPNQYLRGSIERGRALQFTGGQRIGGYGGEGGRACHVEPIPSQARQMWEVHTEMTLAQTEYSKPGVECREVAEKVLKIAERAGMEQYVYQRPAHGCGMEAHEPPYISLGDDTVLAEGMLFSNEPGLYNLPEGYGYKHSNCIVITKAGAHRMNKTPLSKEFCWIKL
jgi:Xaa-Pro dipeptidase